MSFCNIIDAKKKILLDLYKSKNIKETASISFENNMIWVKDMPYMKKGQAYRIAKYLYNKLSNDPLIKVGLDTTYKDYVGIYVGITDKKVKAIENDILTKYTFETDYLPNTIFEKTESNEYIFEGELYPTLEDAINEAKKEIKYFNQFLESNHPFIENLKNNEKITDNQRFKTLNITENSNIEDIVNQSSENIKELYNQLKQRNPNFKIEFTNNREAENIFDPISNSIQISLNQMSALSDTSRLGLKEVFEAIFHHEMIHAASYYALETNSEVYKNVLVLYKELEKKIKNIPFDDKLRSGFKFNNGNPYALQYNSMGQPDLHEFMAEVLSNKYLREYIDNNIDRSFLQKIFDSIRKFLGLKIKTASIYDRLLDIYNSSEFIESNEYINENNLEYNFNYEIKGFNKFDEIENIIIKNNIEKTFTSRIETFTDAASKIKYAFKSKGEQGIINELNKYRDDNKNYAKNISSLMSDLHYVSQILKDQEIKLREKLKEIEQKEILDNKKYPIEKVELLSEYKSKLESFQDYIDLINTVRDELFKGGTSLSDLQSKALTELKLSYPTSEEYDIKSKEILSTFSTFGRIFSDPNLYKTFLEDTISKNEENPIYEYLFNMIGTDSSTAISDLTKKIERLKLEKLNTSDLKTKDKLNKKIKELEKIIEKTPSSPEYFRKELQGYFGDISNAIAWVSDASTSDSSLIRVINTLIINTKAKANKESIEFSNKSQIIDDNYVKNTGKGNLDIANKYKNLIHQIKEPLEVDLDGNITNFVIRDAFKKDYTPEFLTEILRLNLHIRDLKSKIRNSSEDNKEDLNNRLIAAKKAKSLFLEEHTVKKYKKEWYDNEAILDTLIDEKQTLKEYRGDIYQRIEDIEQKINNYDGTSSDIIEEYQKELAEVHVERRALSSTLGKSKDSKEYKAAILLQQYSENRRKMGEYKLSQSSYEYFLSVKKSQASKDNDEEYANWLMKNTKTEIKTEWYEKQKDLADQVQNIQSIIAEKLGLVYTKIDGKSFYDYIKEASKRYRDESTGFIDGILVEDEFRKNIKEQQEALELLYKEGNSMFLTKEEQNELNNPSITKTRKSELLTKIKNSKSLVQNELAQLKSLKEELAKMSIIDVTEMYNEEVDRIKEEIKSNITEDEINSLEVENNSNNYKIKGVGNITVTNPTQFNEGNIEISIYENGILTRQEPIILKFGEDIKNIINAKLKELLVISKYKQSEWFLKNHYKKEVYDLNLKSKITLDEPIYIWKSTRPSDEKYIELEVPNYKYLKYEVKKEIFNPEYFKNAAGTPKVLKTSKYYSNQYDKLTKDEKEYLDYIINANNELDKILDYKDRNGDFIPSARKHGAEATVEGLKNLSKESFVAWWKESFGRTDESLQEEGILNATERSQKRKIPIMFNSKIGTDEQSKDLMGLTLMRHLVLSNRKYLSEIEVPLETILGISKKYDKTEETKTGILRLNKTQSMRSRRIEELLLTELYGETSKNSGTLKIPLIGEVSIDKLVNRVLGFAAKRSFVGNIISPVVNLLSANVQSIINSNMKTGVYDRKSKLWAEAEFAKFMTNGTFVSDYTKFGNKSYIGQLMDLYRALPGNRINNLGQKAQWNKLKNFSEILTSPKDFSEFQVSVTQFLAFMKSNKVPGTNVSLIDAYELKNGTIQQNSTFEDDLFMNKLYDIQLKLNGAYREEQKNLAQKYVLGKAAFFMSNYLVSGFRHRFDGSFSNPDYSIINERHEEGFYITSMKLIKDLFKYGRKDTWDNLTSYEQDNLMRFVKELAIIAIIFLILLILGMGDDDDKNKSIEKKLLLVYLSRVYQEAQTWNPVAGADEILRKIKNPFMFTQTLVTARNVFALIPATIGGYEDAYYQKKSGVHEKGDSKLLVNFLKLISITPSSAAGLDIESLYKIQKQNFKGGSVR